jgi:hypothetical protein
MYSHFGLWHVEDRREKRAQLLVWFVEPPQQDGITWWFNNNLVGYLK